MSYVKTTWVTGDIVTAPKLNNLESGVEANDLNKLNKPSGNGTAGQLLISNGDGSTSWTDTDTTLEESGKAADAKAVGDALGEINEALETKAEIDGYYEEMTVGDAEQLVSTVYVEESTPYLYRTTGGSADVGNREYLDKLVGVSVAWNQLFPFDSDTFTANNVTWSITNGHVVASGTFSASTAFSIFPARIYKHMKLKKDHRYLLYIDIVNSLSFGLSYYMYYSAHSTQGIPMSSGNPRIFVPLYDDMTDSEFIISGTVGSTASGEFNTQLIDLTATFGTTIANYVYSLEQATVGAGVAWLKQYIDLDTYHAYDAGTLKHVEDLQSHDTVGFNQWDEQWELGQYNNSTGEPIAANDCIRTKDYIPVLPNTAYFSNQLGGIMQVFFYDASKNYISYMWINQSAFATPTNCYYMRFRMASSYGTTYKNDICINLSWSGYRNGEYEPYEKHSYALDSSAVLRGVPTLVDGQMVYDGDEYLYDGTINRRYGIVDLGTLDWIYNSSYAVFTANLADAAVEQVNNLVCPLYLSAPDHSSSNPDKTIYTRTVSGVNGIGVKDSAYTDAASFKTAMSGVYLVYKLATPTTETADPYTQVQICDDFGTEQFVTTSIIPVGTETRYPANLRDKLQHLPSLAETDGTYLIQQTNKDMSLIPLAPILEDYVTEESLAETLEDYAVVDGYYEGMTVGNAEELVTGLTEEENVPFIFRTAGGSLEIGAREEMTVTGGSLAWNQLCDADNATINNSYVTYDSTAHTFTITYAQDDSSGSNVIQFNSLPVVNGHKYFLRYKLISSSGTLKIRFYSPNRDDSFQITDNTKTNALFVDGIIFEYATGNYEYIRVGKATSVVDAQSATLQFQLIDLTQLFGTTIADYIYNLEQSTAGAGIAWFRKLFPKDYYPYQAADLVHVNASEFKTVGFNQWDEQWENGRYNVTTGAKTSSATSLRCKNHIKVLPNTQYRVKAPVSAYFVGFDASGNCIGLLLNDGGASAVKNTTITMPSNCYEVVFYCDNYSTYNHDICISIHWDNTRDGEYEPYTEHSYPLDSDLVLRGIPKLDADTNLYYDGDTYEADGTVTRKYGIVDLGTLSWTSQSTEAQYSYYSPVIADLKPAATSGTIASYVCSAVYGHVSPASFVNKGDDLITISTGGRINVNDNSYTTVEQFKTAMSGVYLVYELATPTTETADSYTSPQIVDNWGTEEFVVTEQNGVEIPVGHSTVYPISLKDKLEAAPDLPADSGDYVLRMSGNEASYARLASEFPTPPTTDGSYLLKATVTNGTATLTWEAQS